LLFVLSNAAPSHVMGALEDSAALLSVKAMPKARTPHSCLPPPFLASQCKFPFLPLPKVQEGCFSVGLLLSPTKTFFFAIPRSYITSALFRAPCPAFPHLTSPFSALLMPPPRLLLYFFFFCFYGHASSFNRDKTSKS